MQTKNPIKFKSLSGIAVDNLGNVYFSDSDTNKLYKLTPAGEVVSVAGYSGRCGDADGTGSTARLYFPSGVAVDSAGNVYVADRRNNRIRKVSPAGVVSTLAGSYKGYADGTGAAAQFWLPNGVAVDSAGNVYVADRGNHRIRKVTPDGEVTTLAGSISGFADGKGAAAQFSCPSGVAVDSAGNVYVADRRNNRIRKVTPDGEVTTLAGSSQGCADGTGAAAQFWRPNGVAVDSAGNLFVADRNNHRIRKVTPAGVVTTLAGSSQGCADGTGAAALFNEPYSVAVDSAGNVFVADRNNHRIRKVTPDSVFILP